jgi:hypothetical protein
MHPSQDPRGSIWHIRGFGTHAGLPVSALVHFRAAAVAPSTVWAVGYRYQESLLANRTLTLRTTGV